jgi:hypothetical protein
MKPPCLRLRSVLLSATIGLIVATSVAPAAPPDPAPGARRGRILVIRGLFNVFSLGMDDLACQLQQRGYQVDVTPPALADAAALHIQHEYLRDPSIGPLVIIGHSMGGRQCCSIPWKWREDHIPVKLVVILDSNPEVRVADNVERCVNLYVTNDLGIFHGRPVASDQPQTNMVNVDVTKLPRPPGVPNVNHFDIDDSRWIHSLVVAEVDRTLGPSCAAGDALFSEADTYYVPSDAVSDATSPARFTPPSRQQVLDALQSRIEATRMSRGMNRPVRTQ